MPAITFQVVADHNFLARMADPRFWEVYKMYAIREITEGALATIRAYASRLWKNPSGGGLDQSWFSRYDVAKAMGYIGNTKPYAYWRSVGVRPHKMQYLLNAHNAWYLRDGTKAVTIPLIIDGEKTFRVATAKHMLRNPGGPPWWHPGSEPTHFLEKGMEEYVQTKLRTDYEGLLIRVLGLTT